MNEKTQWERISLKKIQMKRRKKKKKEDEQVAPFSANSASLYSCLRTRIDESTFLYCSYCFMKCDIAKSILENDAKKAKARKIAQSSTQTIQWHKRKAEN